MLVDRFVLYVKSQNPCIYCIFQDTTADTNPLLFLASFFPPLLVAAFLVSLCYKFSITCLVQSSYLICMSFYYILFSLFFLSVICHVVFFILYCLYLCSCLMPAAAWQFSLCRYMDGRILSVDSCCPVVFPFSLSFCLVPAKAGVLFSLTG